MADIDKITASNGTTYNIKDATARDSISQRLSDAAYSGNLNDLKTSGVYYVATSATNLPNAAAGCMIVSYGAWNAIVQVFIESRESNPGFYTRRYGSSGWSSWNKIA